MLPAPHKSELPTQTNSRSLGFVEIERKESPHLLTQVMLEDDDNGETCGSPRAMVDIGARAWVSTARGA